MRGYRVFALGAVVLAVTLCAGCQSPGPRRTVVSPEPSLSGPATADGTQEIQPVKQVTWVDRHPLFSKPRDYWDTSGDNKVVKAAAATFIGVPVGFYGEVKQIIVGTSPEPRY